MQIILVAIFAVFILSGCVHDNNITHNESSNAISEQSTSFKADISANIDKILHDSTANESINNFKNKELVRIYESRNYVSIWFDNQKIKPEAESVVSILANSYLDGLNPDQYHIVELKKLLLDVESVTYKSSNDKAESLVAQFDLLLTDGYLSYAKNMQNGRIDPAIAYSDWSVDRKLVNVESQFTDSLIRDTLLDDMTKIIPNNNIYTNLKGKLLEYYNLISQESDTNALQKDELILKKLVLNMDRARWLPRELPESYIIVNIPKYELDVYTKESESPVLSMYVIVGKNGENKTCLVNSSITTIEFNPYWGIPKRIATKEYLTKLQEDPEYLEGKNIRIFTTGNKEVDPTTIEWSEVNEKNFKYFLRQDPGVKNALGKVKFTFSNSCGIYMHDTANRSLFGRNSRSMSHGCVRIAKPIQLANYLLIDRDKNSESKIKTMLTSDKHSGIKVKEAIPLFITYQTVIMDDNKNVVLLKDIYNVDNVNIQIYKDNSKNI